MVLSYLCNKKFLHGSHITPRTDVWALHSILYRKTFSTSQTEVTYGVTIVMAEIRLLNYYCSRIGDLASIVSLAQK